MNGRKEIILDQGYINILETMIKEKGKDVLLDASKCKGLLSDYTRGEHKKESRLLLLALESKVQKEIDKTNENDFCRLRPDGTEGQYAE